MLKTVLGTGNSKVSAFFQPSEAVDLSTARLKNIGGDTTMVDLQPLDAPGNYKAINVGNTDQVGDMTYVYISDNRFWSD
ncbi:hypothetical protein QP353_23755 [Klebsiella aerogenes]|uniref:hypothetical protein n=1 Tax=Klebsiella aerogenes TaxID=548 RepID=UPI00254D4BFD|nr:hypothetical protein [Klebsiella aerogenes]MDK6932418.1 hypothetical protein [Klebsiella aerogenes]